MQPSFSVMIFILETSKFDILYSYEMFVCLLHQINSIFLAYGARF